MSTNPKKSLASKTLDYLMKNENKDVSVKEIATKLRSDNRTISTTIANNMRRSTSTEWSAVKRTGRGFYGYMPTPSPAKRKITNFIEPNFIEPNQTGPSQGPAQESVKRWQEVGRDGTVIVLSDPDGVVYVARRLGTYA